MPAPEFEENCLEISKQAMPNPEQNKCRVFTEDCYNHPDCMKSLEDKREEKLSKYNEVEKKFDKLGDECSKYLYSITN